MTTKTLTGTYTAGYTLSAAYSALVNNAQVYGAAGNAGGNTRSTIAGGAGGVGVTIPTVAMVTNNKVVQGGSGGAGGQYLKTVRYHDYIFLRRRGRLRGGRAVFFRNRRSHQQRLGLWRKRR